MTAAERWNLRGPVRTCHLQRTCYFRRCGSEACETEEWGDSTTVEFRADGNLAWHSHRNPDGSESRTSYEYDDAGRLLTVRNENAGVLVGQTVCQYDGAGRLERVLSRPKDGGERLIESYEYSISGCQTKTHRVDPATQPPIMAWGIEGTDVAYPARGAVTLTTQYNDRDQPTHVVFRDAAGREVSRVELRYDENGRLVEEAQTNADQAFSSDKFQSLNQAQRETVRGLLGVRREHRYDSHGRRVETSCRMGPLGVEIKKTAYNDHGDPVQEMNEHQQREYGMDDQGRLSDAPTRETMNRSENRIRYGYDAHGNWLFKAVESRGDAQNDFMLSSLERRTPTYFE